ncbi:bifunctional protein-serine/threonine kinase/phosphatase [Hyphomicrobium sp. CS1GBMeth3]|uniref:bifunctional protein-serine/threonine kinase/phosphatase n=1 Tax=Hyphomicrobium sp. CS1GBMeth3 TaxID=1892845 RepID=UPI0009304F42|nr:bifunctional protein-serine/threonine kinase/phosphatase [Hyphomicrobium sp. CS1GBMeth3]
MLTRSSAAGLSLAIGQCSEAGAKPTNQDFHGALVPDGTDRALKGIAVALADGISSSKVSQVAAEIAVKSILTDYYCTSDTWSAKTAGERVIRAVNAWLYAESQRNWLYDNQGYICTLSAIIFKGRTAHIFHIGDSRICQVSGDNFEQLTRDHRMAVSKTESYLNRALGVEPNVEIDYLAVDLHPGDVFVLSTDGVHEFVSPREMAALITSANNLDAAAGEIVAHALANGSDDNLTFQIVRVDSLPEESAQDVLLGAEQALAAEVPRIPYDLDGFRIVREIHATSRSIVYVAIDSETGERVALKVLSSDLRDNLGARRRFAMEEWVARRLNSPHVVRSVKAQRQRNSLYTVSELIEGQTLRQWMHDNPQPSLETVRDIVEQIAKGLRAFHRMEMLHQDIRPDNIMIDASGTVKIIDLGSVRVAGVREAMPETETGDILGTHQYAAPEYFLGLPGTEKSDLFSLGLVAYELLTGSLPYGDSVAGATTPKAQASLFYIPASEFSSRVPEWMDLAIRKAVSIDPSRRYEAISEFVADLRRPREAPKRRSVTPLIERNPLLFWKMLSGGLVLIVLWLLATR